MARKRKIIVYLAVSADGFIARFDGSVDWLARPRPKGNYGMGAFYQTIDTILWGRKTYHMALDFQKKGVSGSAFDARVKNYVFTGIQPQSPAPAGVEFVNEPIKAFATRLRQKKGKDIWIIGGAGIIASLLDEGEIDEFMIHVIPISIGEGIPLIAPGRRTVQLKLISCTRFTDGCRAALCRPSVSNLRVSSERGTAGGIVPVGEACLRTSNFFDDRPSNVTAAAHTDRRQYG
jgi:dihydrofolate reductase